GSVGLKRKADFADADDVAQLQRATTVDLLGLIVEKGAVAAAEILDLVVVPFVNDLAVITTDCTDLDDDVAVGVPSKNRLVPFQLVLAASLGTVICHQKIHNRLNPRPPSARWGNNAQQHAFRDDNSTQVSSDGF